MFTLPYVCEGVHFDRGPDLHGSECVGGIFEGVSGGPLGIREVSEYFAGRFALARDQSRVDPSR
jgi:hypothetical protein